MADDGVLNKAQQKIRNDRIKAAAIKVRKDREAMAKRDAKAKPTNLGTRTKKVKEEKQLDEILPAVGAAAAGAARAAGSIGRSAARNVGKGARGTARFGKKVAHKIGKKVDQYATQRANQKKARDDAEKARYKRMKKFKEHAEMMEDATAGLKKKAEKSGMPLSILRQVYNRGVAAWKTGHRPGTTPSQWGFARVNSFVTKSSGTWGKADKDLAAKVRG